MSASEGQDAVVVVPSLAQVLLYNVQLQTGAVRRGRETSAPTLLQNPLVTWFCLCTALFISRQCAKKKREPRNTQTVSK